MRKFSTHMVKCLKCDDLCCNKSGLCKACRFVTCTFKGCVRRIEKTRTKGHRCSKHNTLTKRDGFIPGKFERL